MKIYLVGGAVRDALLGLPVHDRDYVVVGATPEQMLKDGFKQVGKNFPVFLHPTTAEEYALARVERKTGAGHQGFAFDFSSEVTLEEDLERRDLTINAIAQDQEGKPIDPYGGLDDLESRTLRHVSDAFAEDPLRVLRVARFAARYAALDFSIHPETMALMKTIVHSDELGTLSAERIWQETHKALTTENPDVYFEVLRECGALAALFPEIAVLWGVPNPPQWHPEIDTGIHTMMVLQQACLLSDLPVVRFAALCHDLGKGVTPKDQWPSHRGHESAGIPIIKQLCERLKIPNDYRRLAELASAYHLHVHKLFEIKASTLAKVFAGLDAYRKPERVEQFAQVCEADARGRTGLELRPYPQSSAFLKCFEATRDVDIKALVEKGLNGEAMKNAIHTLRVNAIKPVLAHYAKINREKDQCE